MAVAGIFLLFSLLPATGNGITVISFIILSCLLYICITVLSQRIATYNEDDIVQCFNDVTSCNANSNDITTTAGQCCNSAGGSSRHIRVVFQGNQAFCGSCFSELQNLI